ncbi:MAG: DUF2764 family protein [Candidatus Cloacimonetes bacterium]|nr:DUF2764 family protein [Candidatus Cloacimonadota bacterium]
MRAQYYYFVTGLPALSIDDSKSQISCARFLTDAENQLTAADFKLLLLLRLPEDADDLARIIHGKEEEGRPVEEQAKAFWKSYIGRMKARAAGSTEPLTKDYKVYPEFWHEAVLAAFSAEEMPPYLDTRHRLLAGSYEFCSGLGNKFLSGWYEFNRDLQNLLTAINGRQHKVDYSRWLVGSGELVEKLSRSNAADFGLGKGHELFESVWRVWEQNNILYRERGYDILRWKWIDNHNFFNYFNIDRVLGYYAQLRILERWLNLDPGYGKEMFHDTMDALSGSFAFPEIFKVKSIRKA